jgi:hypothetical protein
MSFQEKRTLTSLISTLLSSAVYFAVVYQRYQAENFSTVEEIRFWTTVILLYVPIQVVAQIILYIIFYIINVIATQEEEPKVVDELDKLINRKSTLYFYHVFIGGFFLAMATQVLKMSISAMFICLCITMVVAGTILDISQLYFYRRGV